MKIKEIVQRIFKKEAKVHILLDIDGVLNPNKEPIGEYEIISHPWGRWTVRTDVLDWVKEISSTNAVQVHWISTWEDESNVINEYLKIKEFPYFRVNGTVVEGKLKAIKEQLELSKGETIIVVDDSLDRGSSIIAGAGEREHKLVTEILNLSDKNQNSLHVIVPDENVGITDDEIEMINCLIKQTLTA